jgi:endogenous inhibitor of DNA gyrase (YacG/DUF329 family)
VRFNCPTCGRAITVEDGTRAAFPTLPFCSPRCRNADLGSWLNESYRIAAPVSEEDLDAGLPDRAGPDGQDEN